MNENKRIRLFQFLFSKEYFDFMINLRDISFNMCGIRLSEKNIIYSDYKRLVDQKNFNSAEKGKKVITNQNNEDSKSK